MFDFGIERVSYTLQKTTWVGGRVVEDVQVEVFNRDGHLMEFGRDGRLNSLLEFDSVEQIWDVVWEAPDLDIARR